MDPSLLLFPKLQVSTRPPVVMSECLQQQEPVVVPATQSELLQTEFAFN